MERFRMERFFERCPSRAHTLGRWWMYSAIVLLLVQCTFCALLDQWKRPDVRTEW